MGGDTGLNTPFLKSAQLVHIYDIHDKEVLGPAKKINYDELTFHDYDLIVCRQVFEHVSYPVDLLKLIIRSMSHETILYVDLPHEYLMYTNNVDPLSKKYWHEHINFFSLKAIYLLLPIH